MAVRRLPILRSMSASCSHAACRAAAAGSRLAPGEPRRVGEGLDPGVELGEDVALVHIDSRGMVDGSGGKGSASLGLAADSRLKSRCRRLGRQKQLNRLPRCASCGRLSAVLRPGNWIRPAGESPVRVKAGEPGSRPRFVVERRRAERGVKSLFGGSKRAGRSATRRESCSLVTSTTGEPSRSCHGEGSIRPTGVPDMPLVGSPRGMGSGTYARPDSGQERPVCAASSAKTARISQW